MPNRPLRKKVHRHALVTFISLAVVFIAQLTWWAIFHVLLLDERFEDYQRFAGSRSRELAGTLAPEFESARDLLLLDAANLTAALTDSLARALEKNRFVAGVTIIDDAGDTVFSFGSPAGDAGVRIAKEGAVVQVALDYSRVRQLAGAYEPRLDFSPPHPDSVFFRALSAANFPPDAEEAGAYQEERSKSLTMLYWEGGFFLFLTLFGLGLIFRALVHSEDARRMQDNFLMAVTHELRTPLASLKLSMQGISRGKLAPEKAEKVYGMIEADLNRLGGLIDDLIEAGKSRRERHIHPEPIDLPEFLESYLRARRSEFEHRDADVSFDVAAGLRPVYISPGDLKRTLDVAIDNAIKFSDGPAKVTVTASEADGKAVVSVRDEGIGVSAEELPRLFDRFYRVGNELTRRRPGTGLGLYLGREILRAYGGDMRVASEGLGKGTTVTIAIPFAPEEKS